MKDLLFFIKQIHTYAGKMLYINLFAMTMIGLLDGIGVLLLVPMISMTGIVDLGLEESPIANLFSVFNEIPITLGLPIILCVYVFIVILHHVVERSVMIGNTKIQIGFLRYLRTETYEKVLRANWSFFIRKRKSDLINLLLSEVARTSSGTNSVLQLFSSFIFSLIQIAIALWLSVKITLFVLVAGLFIVYLNRRYLKKSHALGSRNYELGKNFLAGMTDQINGIKDIKSNNLVESRMSWVRTMTAKMEEEQVEYTRIRMTSQLNYKISSAIFLALFIVVSVNIFHAQAGELLLIILIFSRLWPRVAGIQASLEQIASTLPSFKAVKSLQIECVDSAEFLNANSSDIKPILFQKGFEFRNIHFRYNKDQEYALKDINIFIPANQMTAIVGRSGAGKSTLIDLIMGLNEAEKGEIFIDNKQLTKENLFALRQSIGYVPQDPFLFNESIRENLLLVAPEATEEQLWDALEFASAAGFVRMLSDGLDTLIGDRGIKLSGGERQRLVLARAILRKPPLLVLDEATSSLDTESERKIQEALDKLKGTLTIVVIAHRLSTIRNADQVIVLEQGEVIQQGGFQQLSEEQNQMFSKLLGRQLEVM
ncbi:ABC transporter ATP-binding protein [Cytobacillus purgationiresistens]|uniref:ATP-binding cassette subfamily C protein n=1 Tax=Cytobacillus purgationiresistens TaxID=863449 RepID=A0ABU0AI64_9BACI|nr:ABC transporter ATP-binding protein [Cytobacillus purgationiresistens]MDQ0270940.1 ATP-binding cassette subfamily C protein [Cytobacillus purgationiresistens]